MSGEERWRDNGTMDEGNYKGGNQGEEALITGAPPSPAKEAPLQAEEITHQIAEVEQPEGVGISPSLSLT